jgi:hypothetical protein
MQSTDGANTVSIAIVGNIFNSMLLLQELATKYKIETFATLQEWRNAQEPGISTAVRLSWDEATTETLMEFTDIIETELDDKNLSNYRKFDSSRVLRGDNWSDRPEGRRREHVSRSIGHVPSGDINEMMRMFNFMIASLLCP